MPVPRKEAVRGAILITITELLIIIRYDRETFLVPVPDESKIPPAHAPDPNKILATTKCKFDAGPYPEAGCEQCYNGCERVSC